MPDHKEIGTSTEAFTGQHEAPQPAKCKASTGDKSGQRRKEAEPQGAGASVTDDRRGHAAMGSESEGPGPRERVG